MLPLGGPSGTQPGRGHSVIAPRAPVAARQAVMAGALRQAAFMTFRSDPLGNQPQARVPAPAGCIPFRALAAQRATSTQGPRR